MARTMLECIEDVIMKDGTKAFTKGKLYRPYRYNIRDLWEITPVLCAKNDQKERHIIKYLRSDKLDPFYYKHFKEVKVDGSKKSASMGRNELSSDHDATSNATS
jgi:hypothetical protein